ncbi:glycine cleavage system aminomethyltransferase GcvT [Enhygromyxa salina]|uniref:Aminomethyltransferase n=1 Tax=Enhygromyxa salina TaxID=215803 RepID=A0A2S9Y2K0_9BACT|nr:glycine cleavage system aminomethyltransferase GcvT [Enhygromyxa salina]PRP99319.1 Aminomethyltransferase [Enhygromyxa salina]
MAALLSTPLHAAHVAAGAKMVDFTGWHMPVQYAGILAEHKAVREDVGLFDVSHMGEIDFEGPQALAAVQKLITNDVTKLVDGQALYTAVCLQSGGIVDDCIVYRQAPERVRIVVNASNIAKDEAHFREHAGGMCEIINRSDETALIAVQGPRAIELSAQLSAQHSAKSGGASLADIKSFHFGPGEIAGKPVVAARTGYTGEDGFELFVAADHAHAVWDALIAGGAAPCGLGARDTLRLEAKLCLYGNDIDATTSPLEAGLGWVVKLAAGEFVGSEALAAQKRDGVARQLIGFRVQGKGTPRHDWELVASTDDGAEVIGHVTSGGPAPTVGGSVGIGYVRTGYHKPGTLIAARSKHKLLPVEIVKGPFYRRAT